MEAKPFSKNEHAEEFYKATLNAVQNSLKALKLSQEAALREEIQKNGNKLQWSRD